MDDMRKWGGSYLPGALLLWPAVEREGHEVLIRRRPGPAQDAHGAAHGEALGRVLELQDLGTQKAGEGGGG